MTKQLEKINCAICSADNTEDISTKGQFNLPINLVLCKDCGLGYLNPRWDKLAYSEFYQKEYDKYYRSELTADFKLSPRANNTILSRLAEWKHLPDNINNLLDIGSGAGQNLIDFKQQYPAANLFAIEPSPDSHEHLSSINAKVISTDVDSDWASGESPKYDFVIMRHVLEHFLDPVAVMKKVHKALAPNGLLYVAVPNNLKPSKKLESHCFRVVHTYYFNKFSLYNLFALAQLEILEVGEGDHLNQGEVFLVARPASEILSPKIDSADFDKQRIVFANKLREENRFIPRLKRTINNLIKK